MALSLLSISVGYAGELPAQSRQDRGGGGQRRIPGYHWRSGDGGGREKGNHTVTDLIILASQSSQVFLFPRTCQIDLMATEKKADREAELEAAIEAIRKEAWKQGQTLPKLRHAIALILQELKR